MWCTNWRHIVYAHVRTAHRESWICMDSPNHGLCGDGTVCTGAAIATLAEHKSRGHWQWGEEEVGRLRRLYGFAILGIYSCHELLVHGIFDAFLLPTILRCCATWLDPVSCFVRFDYVSGSVSTRKTDRSYLCTQIWYHDLLGHLCWYIGSHLSDMGWNRYDWWLLCNLCIVWVLLGSSHPLADEHISGGLSRHQIAWVSTGHGSSVLSCCKPHRTAHRWCVGECSKRACS